MITKVPPYSDEAEKSVLGCMLLDKDAVIIALNMLNTEDFYIDRNKWVFEAISEQYRRGFAIDFVTIIDKLNVEGITQKIGASYIADLQDIVTNTKHIENYCRIVTEKAALREMIVGFSDIVARCYDNKDQMSDILESAESLVYNMSVNRTRSEFLSLKDSIKPVIVKIGELYQRNEPITGISTGYKDLDRITSGFQRSDFILIAARPSMGKTALGLNIAANAAIRGDKTVAFFSLEMSTDQLIMRIISSESEVNSAKIKIGSQTHAEWKKLTMLNSKLEQSDVDMYIDDTSAISIGEIRSKLRKLKSTRGLDLVIIDYLQLDNR